VAEFEFAGIEFAGGRLASHRNTVIEVSPELANHAAESKPCRSCVGRLRPFRAKSPANKGVFVVAGGQPHAILKLPSVPKVFKKVVRVQSH
jgi:hypothetical protein